MLTAMSWELALGTPAQVQVEQYPFHKPARHGFLQQW